MLTDSSFEIKFEEISSLRWLGSGAQGAVFYGKHRGQEVAVKKVKHLKEINIRHLRKLNHPNIITFKYVWDYLTHFIGLIMGLFDVTGLDLTQGKHCVLKIAYSESME